MAQKHLHELLKEDQEPFYITNRRFHLKRPNFSSPKTSSLQIKKTQKPINQTPTSKFCKNSCFSSFNDSPELRKSPLYLPSPTTKKRPEDGKFVLHVPARTASLLLEAAMRIQKQRSSSKPKNQTKKVKFGAFGSILKRLKDRNATLTETQGMTEYNKLLCSGSSLNSVHGNSFSTINCTFFKNQNGIGAKILNETAFNNPLLSRSSSELAHDGRFDVSNSNFSKAQNGTFAEMLNKAMNNRPSWSDPFQDVVDDDSFSPSNCIFSNDQNGNKKGKRSFSCSCNEESCMDFSSNGDFGSSSLSPFRFSLQRCSSSGDVMPEFTSPAASPVCHKKEEKENYEIIALERIDELEEDEKEQCSPVSVLDPPFEEEEGQENGDEEEEDVDLDCSYALVQRAQQQLLYKLCRFEKLAELDPIELEKILVEEEKEENSEDHVEEGFEEKSKVKSFNYGEAVFERKCKRFHSSQELKSNITIDMMVKWDLKNEFDERNKFQKEREEIAIAFSFSIFQVLVEELGEELIHLANS